MNYVTGDATRPQGEGKKIICHICNSIGGWGAGFVLAISKRWKEPEIEYRRWFREGVFDWEPFELGNVQTIKVSDDIWVANMIAQQGIGKDSDGRSPFRPEALRKCLRKVCQTAKDNGMSVHMPRIGCGLAGGKWSEVKTIVEEELCQKGISVTVYDLG